MFKAVLHPDPSAAIKKRSHEPLWVFKANPYRDGTNGQFTSKDKANYQGNKLYQTTTEMAQATMFDKASLYVQTPHGKKAISEFATDYSKYAKSMTESGLTPGTVKQFLNAQVNDSLNVATLEAKIQGSLNAKKAWVKIYQKKALESVDKEYPELFAAVKNAMPGSMAEAKALAKMDKKIAAWKDQYLSNGGDPATFQSAIQKASGVALGASESSDYAPGPTTLSTSPLTAPKGATSFVAHDNKNYALFQNTMLGHAYYISAKQNGKDSPLTAAAYAEWKKAKDHLVDKGFVSAGDIPGMSSKVKQSAQDLINQSDNTAKQAIQATKDAQKSAMDKLAVAAQAAAHYEASDPAGTSGDYASFSNVLSKMESDAKAAGVSTAQIEVVKQSAKNAVVAEAKAKEQMANLMKGGAKELLDYYDAPSRKFHNFSGDGPGGKTAKEYSAYVDQRNSALTSKERDAIQGYTGSGYKSQNKVIAGSENSTHASNANAVMSAAMAKSSIGYDMKLRRNAPQKWFWAGLGVSLDQLEKMTASEISQYEGRTYTEKAFSSTTKNLTFTSNYSNEAGQTGALSLMIRAKKDTRGIDVSAGSNPISSHVNEQEVILDKGTTYLIRKITPNQSFGKGGIKYIVDVDVIGHI